MVNLRPAWATQRDPAREREREKGGRREEGRKVNNDTKIPKTTVFSSHKCDSSIPSFRHSFNKHLLSGYLYIRHIVGPWHLNGG
jgi:hypothetical protein